ncbi:MAG: deoxyribose-phosphate aldolase [Chitinophagales bacterium]|nr:deoxyribose-phosphate aldolase [Chitinophagales bacterium]
MAEMSNIASYIEHTVLKPVATLQDVRQLCEEAAQYHFAVAMVPPIYVAEARSFLIGSKVNIGTVIGFPLGYNLTETKLTEAELAINDGADDIDMVVNISAVKSGNWDIVAKDIAMVTHLCKENGKIVKVIFESGLLDDKEIIQLCEICNALNINYAKTSTGFATIGATIDAVKLMRATLNKDIKIKASGGIKTKEDAQAMIAAGADRIGTSSGITMII